MHDVEKDLESSTHDNKNDINNDNDDEVIDNNNDEFNNKPLSFLDIFKQLGFVDRVFPLLVLISMIVGVVIGVFAEDGVTKHLKESAKWENVSIPLLIGLIIMIWPPLTVVQWELFPTFFKSISIWVQIALSLIINWIISPFIMLALAWITLPDSNMERYRRGVVLVGVARCIAMVLIWNTISKGDKNFCAILVLFNSLLQVVLFSPYSILFVNMLSTISSNLNLQLDYSQTAKVVGIYLGIPLAAGIILRFLVKILIKPKFQSKVYDIINQISAIGLLYTIIILYAEQGKRVIDNIGKVFRTFVPLSLYFLVMWSLTFIILYGFNKRRHNNKFLTKISKGSYERLVSITFTASSNNFELAIAVSAASFGSDSPETLACTLGVLTEVPILLLLSYFALYLKNKLKWSS